MSWKRYGEDRLHRTLLILVQVPDPVPFVPAQSSGECVEEYTNARELIITDGIFCKSSQRVFWLFDRWGNFDTRCVMIACTNTGQHWRFGDEINLPPLDLFEKIGHGALNFCAYRTVAIGMHCPKMWRLPHSSQIFEILMERGACSCWYTHRRISCIFRQISSVPSIRAHKVLSKTVNFRCHTMFWPPVERLP